MAEEKQTGLTAHERAEREKFARHETCKDFKEHYEKKGIYRSGEQIEREVSKIQEDVAKRKDHSIYKD